MINCKRSHKWYDYNDGKYYQSTVQYDNCNLEVKIENWEVTQSEYILLNTQNININDALTQNEQQKIMCMAVNEAAKNNEQAIHIAERMFLEKISSKMILQNNLKMEQIKIKKQIEKEEKYYFLSETLADAIDVWEVL